MHENQDNPRLAVYDRCVPFHRTDRTLHRHSNFDQPSQWHDRNTSASDTIGWVPRGLWRDSTFVYSASSSASTCSACHSPNFTPSNLGLAPTPSSGGGASQVRATGWLILTCAPPERTVYATSCSRAPKSVPHLPHRIQARCAVARWQTREAGRGRSRNLLNDGNPTPSNHIPLSRRRTQTLCALRWWCGFKWCG